MPLLTLVGVKGLPDPIPGFVTPCPQLGFSHNHSSCWALKATPTSSQNSGSQCILSPVATGRALLLVTHEETEEQGQDSASLAAVPLAPGKSSMTH